MNPVRRIAGSADGGCRFPHRRWPVQGNKTSDVWIEMVGSWTATHAPAARVIGIKRELLLRRLNIDMGEDSDPVALTDFKSDGTRQTRPVGSTPTLVRQILVRGASGHFRSSSTTKEVPWSAWPICPPAQQAGPARAAVSAVRDPALGAPGARCRSRRVAIVSSAGLMLRGERPVTANDVRFRAIAHDAASEATCS